MNDDLSDVDIEIARLLDCGAMVPHGVSEEGRLIYTFDMDKLEAESPAIYEAVLEATQEDLLDLFQQDLIDIDSREDLTAKWTKGEE